MRGSRLGDEVVTATSDESEEWEVMVGVSSMKFEVEEWGAGSVCKGKAGGWGVGGCQDQRDGAVFCSRWCS